MIAFNVRDFRAQETINDKKKSVLSKLNGTNMIMMKIRRIVLVMTMIRIGLTTNWTELEGNRREPLGAFKSFREIWGPLITFTGIILTTTDFTS